MNAAPLRSLTLREPERALRAIGASTELDLREFTLTEMWALTAIAVRARSDERNPLTVVWQPGSSAQRFATAGGFEDVINGKASTLAGEASRTVRLCRVADEDQIRPVSHQIATLIAGDLGAPTTNKTAFLTIDYVIIELLRNVLQHSDDSLGAIVGAQLNDKGSHSDHPVFQVAVADRGSGIRATLSRTHPEVVDDDVALEQALWPYHSGAFAPGKAGGLENAGLGLFYISEMAKELGGRLLVASGDSALLVDPRLQHRIERLKVGFPGTLVAFEIPTEVPDDFDALFNKISETARARSPRKLTKEWLRFEAPPSHSQRFMINAFVENNEEALRLAQDRVIPRLMKKEPVVLDFLNVRVITQSFAHALLFEPVRYAWASQTPIFISNAQPVVASALRHVEMYAQDR